jgi:hypothetical protein
MGSKSKKATTPGKRVHQDKTRTGTGIYHPSARPMEVVEDAHGDWWLCDKGVNTHRNFLDQGCWRCGERAFTRDD